MNFQQVATTAGQKDQKGFPFKMMMFGTISELGAVSLNQNQKQQMKVKLIDDQGQQHTVTLYGTFPPATTFNTRQPFNLWAFQSQHGIGYAGMWQGGQNANTLQGAVQQVFQRTPQPQQQPKQDKPDWDAISRGKVRHGVVCAYLSAGQEPTIGQVEEWANYIMAGPTATPNTPIDEPPPPDDSDIPF